VQQLRLLRGGIRGRGELLLIQFRFCFRDLVLNRAPRGGRRKFLGRADRLVAELVVVDLDDVAGLQFRPRDSLAVDERALLPFIDDLDRVAFDAHVAMHAIDAEAAEKNVDVGPVLAQRDVAGIRQRELIPLVRPADCQEPLLQTHPAANDAGLSPGGALKTNAAIALDHVAGFELLRLVVAVAADRHAVGLDIDDAVNAQDLERFERPFAVGPGDGDAVAVDAQEEAALAVVIDDQFLSRHRATSQGGGSEAAGLSCRGVDYGPGSVPPV
jgi:hypothetical protein